MKANHFRLIAIMLGRLKMNIAECIDAYRKLFKQVLKNKSLSEKYKERIRRSKGLRLDQALKDILNQHGYNERTLLKDPRNPCKV